MLEVKTFVFYLLVMSGTTYLIRVLPLIFIKRKITNRFICSFLYYVPYAVLTVMAFPAVLNCTGNYISGTLAFLVCLAVAYFSKSMFAVAISGALVALASECVMRYLIPLL